MMCPACTTTRAGAAKARRERTHTLSSGSGVRTGQAVQQRLRERLQCGREASHRQTASDIAVLRRTCSRTDSDHPMNPNGVVHEDLASEKISTGVTSYIGSSPRSDRIQGMRRE
jgi:hypothetical protein